MVVVVVWWCGMRGVGVAEENKADSVLQELLFLVGVGGCV